MAEIVAPAFLRGRVYSLLNLRNSFCRSLPVAVLIVRVLILRGMNEPPWVPP